MSRYIFALICLALPAFPQIPGLRFEANLGQADSRFRYLARVHGRPVGLTDSGFESANVHLRFANSNPEARWEPLDRLQGTSSYFIGADSSRWIRNAPHYSRLLRRSAYPGIDIVFRGTGELLEFDFLVAPNADPGKILLTASEGTALRLLPNGDLQTGAAVLRRPTAWQTIGGRKVEVAARFRLDAAGREAAITLGAYDRSQELVIDPLFDGWSFAGGSGTDRITVVLPDLVAGVTDSADWAGGNRHGKDIFIGHNGNYTVYGGSGDEEITSAVALPEGIVIAGWTSSTDFPIAGRPAPAQALYGGGKRDGFLIYGNLSWSTYFGGSGDDAILTVALAPGDHYADATTLLIGGETTSPNLPAESGVQPSPGGGRDGFLARMPTSGATVLECTYWGGAGDDAITAVDASPVSYWIGGRTRSAEFPGVEAQRKAAGGMDGFLARLDRAGGTHVGLFTFLGGSGDDDVRALRIGPDRQIQVGGVTASADLPVTAASQTERRGATDIWLGRFHPATGAASWLTYLGGSGSEELSAMVLDANGDAWLAGATTSDDLPVVDALQDRPGGGQDGLLARVDSSGAVGMLSYFGGAGDDVLRSVTFTPSLQVQAGGESGSDSIPALAQAPSELQAGQVDGLWLKFRQEGIYATPVVIGKGLYASLPVNVVSRETGLPVTAVSTDTDRLRVSQTYQGCCLLKALADSGQTDVLVVVPGFPTRRVPVLLRPSYIVIGYTGEQPVMLGGDLHLSLPTGTTHPDTGEVIFQPPQESTTDTGIWLSPDPFHVISVSNSPYPLIHGMELGPATVRVESTLYGVLGPPEIRVRVIDTYRPAVTAPDVVVGKLLQSAVPVSIRQSAETSYSAFPIRFTTEDPSRVVLATAPEGDSAESVTINHPGPGGTQPVVWVRGLAAAGIVRVRMDVEGSEPAWFRVALAGSALGLAIGPATNDDGSPRVRDLSVTTATLDTWTTRPVLSVYTVLATAGPPGFQAWNQVVLPGAGNHVSILSSNGEVVCCTNTALSFDTAAGKSFLKTMASRLGPGTAELRVAADAYTAGPPITVTVYQDRVPLIQKDVVVGKDTVVSACWKVSVGFPYGTAIVATSGDPSKLLLMNDQDRVPSTSVRPTSCLYLLALSESGDVPVKFESPGLSAQSMTVHLVPTWFRLVPPSFSPTAGNTATFSLEFRHAGKPGWAWSPNAMLRPGFDPEFTVRSSDPGILRATSPTFKFGLGGTPAVMDAVAAGTVEVRIEPVSDVRLAPEGATARVTVLPLTVLESQTPVILGKDLQRTVPLDFSYRIPAGTAVHVRSSDPSRVLVSDSPEKAGSAEVDLTSSSLYVQALADSGEASVILTAPGHSESRIPVRLYPSAFGVFTGYELSQTIAADTGIEHAFEIQVMPKIVDPATGLPFHIPVLLRGGLGPVSVRLKSSNEAFGRIYQPAPFTSTLTSSVAYFRIDIPGETILSAEPPPGMAEGGPALRVKVISNPIRFRLKDLALGKDVQTWVPVEVLSAGTAQFPVTLTSSDPSRLTVSTTTTSLGGASATAWSKGGHFYVSALADSGTVTLTAATEGVETGKATVRLEPSWFAMPSLSDYSLKLRYRQGQELRIRLSSPSDMGPSEGGWLRPEIGKVLIPFRSSNEQAVAIPALMEFPSGSGEAVAYVQAGQPGSATITMGAPDGFRLAPEPWRSRDFTVSYRTLSFSSGTIPKDHVLRIGTLPPLDYPAIFHVVSSDPGKLRLSTDATFEGAAELNVAATNDGWNSVYLHGIAETEGTKILVSAEGFEPGEYSFRVVPQTYRFSPGWLTLRAGTTSTEGWVYGDGGGQVRPGAAPVTMELVSSNPAVVEAGAAVINPGQAGAHFLLTAKSAGTAIITVRADPRERPERLEVTVTGN